MTGVGGDTFQQRICAQCFARRLFVKCKPVHGVDDAADASGFRGQSADEARLGSVRVHDVVIAASQKLPQAKQTLKIAPRTELAPNHIEIDYADLVVQ